nr:RsmE family RNA methyltransferase [Polaribacter tangerinus]
MILLKKDFDGQICIAHCEDHQKNHLKSVIKPLEKTTVLIGPEGDFSVDEIKKALDKKFTPISLGESRLRTETAGLVAVNLVSFVNE